MSLPGRFNYEIIVPSRKRPHCMKKLLAMVPSAIVTVHESERESYEAFVPKKQLVLHTVTGGGPAIRNWMMDHFQAPVQIQMDDDLQYVETQIGKRKRRIKRPDDIIRILENQVVCMTELNLGMFCFSRVQNNAMAKPEALPFRLVYPVSSTIAFGGPGRHRYFTEECCGRADSDMTMMTLQQDRILLSDMRFYFNHNAIFSGKGGKVGLLTGKDLKKATENLTKRWGKYMVSEKKPKFGQKNVGQISMSIRVNRKSPMADR